MTTETRTPGVRCPQCGRYLGEVVEGASRFVCHGYSIAVERTKPPHR